MSDPPDTFQSTSGVSLSVQSCLVFQTSRTSSLQALLHFKRPYLVLYFQNTCFLVSCGLYGMASAVFEGTSLVNMFVKDCWVNGFRKLIINPRGEEEEFFDIRTEWSDRNVLYLHRSYADLGRLFKRLLDCFPEDRRDLSKSPLIEGR